MMPSMGCCALGGAEHSMAVAHPYLATVPALHEGHDRGSRQERGPNLDVQTIISYSLVGINKPMRRKAENG
jgi:hypothetical protein